MKTISPEKKMERKSYAAVSRLSAASTKPKVYKNGESSVSCEFRVGFRGDSRKDTQSSVTVKNENTVNNATVRLPESAFTPSVDVDHLRKLSCAFLRGNIGTYKRNKKLHFTCPNEGVYNKEYTVCEFVRDVEKLLSAMKEENLYSK